MEIICEAHEVAGEKVLAVGHSRNPEWAGYWLCAECITEYDSREPMGTEDAH